MTQYGNMLYFYILFLTFIPAIILGICGKKIKYYGFAVTLVMIYLLIGNSKTFLLFCVCETVLIEAYFYIRKKSDNIWLMRAAVVIAIMPLVIVKASPHFTTTVIGFIGISYVTFRIVQIIIETHDGLIHKINLLDLLYFILFFPTASSGQNHELTKYEQKIKY